MARKDLELEVHSLRFKHYTSDVRTGISRIVRNERCKDTSDTVIDGLWETCRDDLLGVLAQQGNETYSGVQGDDVKLSVQFREIIRSYIDQALDYEAELADSEDDYFEKLYRTTVGPVVKANREQRDQSARENDRWAFFNTLDADADFDRWRDRLLSPAQAVALSFGKDPDVVTPERLVPYRGVRRSPFRESFKDRLDLIEAAVAAGELPIRMPVRGFSDWAVAHDLELPQELTSNRVETFGEAAFWKSKFEAAQSQLNALRSSIDDLPPKSKISIYRLIVGMAAARFEYRTDQRTKATSNIREGLLSVNISMEDEAILRNLRAAASALDYEWTTPIPWSGVRRPKS